MALHGPPLFSHPEPAAREAQQRNQRRRKRIITAVTTVVSCLILFGCISGAVFVKQNFCISLLHPFNPFIQTAGGIITLPNPGGLRVVRLTTGALVWQEPAGIQYNALAGAGDRVYYSATNEQRTTDAGTLTARDSTNGTQLWQNMLPTNTTISKLLVTQTMVIALASISQEQAGSFQTDIDLFAWRITDGALLWNVAAVQNIDPWYPSPRENYLELAGAFIVLHNPSAVQVFDATSGTKLWQFIQATASPPVVIQAVSISTTDIIIETAAFTMSAPGQLLDFAPLTGHQLWQATLGQFAAITPVMFGDHYYVMDGTTLIARQAHTGAALWQTPTTLVPSFAGLYAVGDALTLIGPVQNSTTPNSISPDLTLLVLDPATGQPRTQATVTNGVSQENSYTSVGGKVWLEQGISTLVVYDVRSATRLFTARQPDSTAPLSNQFAFTPDATIIAFTYVNNGGCPIRYGQGIQMLDPNTGRVLWTYRHTLLF